MKSVISALLILIALAGCTAKQQLYDRAERSEAEAAQWRTADADGLQLHYADQAQEQAKQAREKADNMPFSEEILRGVLGILFGGNRERK